MTQLPPAVQARLQLIVQKWDGFVAKVGHRSQEILAEAQEGIDQILAQYPTDAGPMGTAMTAVQTRFHGLHQKVSDSWDKIGEELEEVEGDDDLSPEAYRAMCAVTDEMHRKYEVLLEQIDMQYAWLEMRKQADWGRRLWDIAQQEIQQPLTCSQCGAPFQNTVYWVATNMNCPHCGSVNSVHPGMAAGLFYQGLGVHALSHEQAWDQWMAQQSAEKQYKDRRHQTAGDHHQWLRAAHAYWTKYYETSKQMNPGFTQAVEEAVANRLAQYTSFEQPLERMHRDFFQALCQTAAQRDPGALVGLLGNMPNGVDLNDCAECLVEQGDEGGAVAVLEHQHRVEGEDDPRGEWVTERLKEIRETLGR